MQERVWRNRTLLYCGWQCKLIQPLWRTKWRFLWKLGIKLPYNLAIPLLGIYPEKTTILKDTCTSIFTIAVVKCSNIYNSQDMLTTLMSFNRWMDKEVVVHLYNGILLSHKKAWSFSSWSRSGNSETKSLSIPLAHRLHRMVSGLSDRSQLKWKDSTQKKPISRCLY